GHAGGGDDGLRLSDVARRGERGEQRARNGQRGGEECPRDLEVLVRDQALGRRRRGVLLARHHLARRLDSLARLRGEIALRFGQRRHGVHGRRRGGRHGRVEALRQRFGGGQRNRGQ